MTMGEGTASDRQDGRVHMLLNNATTRPMMLKDDGSGYNGDIVAFSGWRRILPSSR